MYEFILTERGWLLVWGPPPRPARPAEPEPRASPAPAYVSPNALAAQFEEKPSEAEPA